MGDVQNNGWHIWGKNMMGEFGNRFMASTIGRFLLTFITLHSFHWSAMAIYTAYCVDISIYGFFNSFITGHGPVCHGLLSVAYFAQSTMFSLLTTAGISAGITFVSDLLLKKADTNE